MSVDSVSGTSSSSVLDQYKLKDNDKTKDSSLGKDQFLQLLVAQMNNQNPLDPQTNSEFVAQLAQFSTVEGLDNPEHQCREHPFQHPVLAGAAGVLPGRPQGHRHHQQGGGGHQRDHEGQHQPHRRQHQRLRQRAGQQGQHRQPHQPGRPECRPGQLHGDGKDSSGNVAPNGTYTFQAEAAIDGKTVAMSTNLPANVDSVTLGLNGAEMTLNLAGLGSVALSKVKVIGQ